MSAEIPSHFFTPLSPIVNHKLLISNKIPVGHTLFEHALSFYSWYKWFQSFSYQEESAQNLQIIMQIANYAFLTPKEEVQALFQLSELREKLLNCQLHTTQISLETQKIIEELTSLNTKSRIAMYLTQIEMESIRLGKSLSEEYKEMSQKLLCQMGGSLSELKTLEISRILSKEQHSNSNSNLLEIFCVKILPLFNES